MKLVECVPNFSEGRDKSVIDEISKRIKSLEGVVLLDVDSGIDTNRTVMTMVGDPKSISNAAFEAIKAASDLIDMSKHHGSHSRIGATDVCPIIPISEISINECIDLSENLAKRVGEELNIPVFLYEKSAKDLNRVNLANIRKGEYEGLAQKLNDIKWKPDFGPSTFNKKSGATVIGVRDFLIAYNINLNTTNVRIATDIAFEIREKGRSKRKPNPKSPILLDGEIIRDKRGAPIKKSGLFKDVKAVGWYVDEFKCAQISINFNNYKKSTIHEVFDKVCELANERGVRVTGSELVGLIPLDAMLMAGNFFLSKQRSSNGIPENDIIKNESPKFIVAGHTYQTRDYMPRVSAKLGAPFIPDVIAVNDNGYTKQILNAKLNAEISTSSELFILSFQSATFSEDDLRPGSCEVESFHLELDSNIVRSVTEDPFQEEQGDVDLESADVLISVGRGIEKEENVPLAFELARKMGAEVSASRPIVDSGWIETFRQVGSSGSNVAPKLYFSLGISGAIQHVVGMKGSKKIMAINKDSDAPIFEIADYAIIGDVLEIVPKLIEALEQN